MKYLLFVLLISLAGCATIEERCETEVADGYFTNMQQCIAFRYQQQQNAGNALQNMGQSINQQNSGGTDAACVNQCVNKGSTIQYCNSACSY